MKNLLINLVPYCYHGGMYVGTLEASTIVLLFYISKFFKVANSLQYMYGTQLYVKENDNLIIITGIITIFSNIFILKFF